MNKDWIPASAGMTNRDEMGFFARSSILQLDIFFISDSIPASRKIFGPVVSETVT